MANDNPRQWMWDEALDMLARAERLHRQMFQPTAAQARQPCWEPPIDVLETEAEVVIIAALPGVTDASLKLLIDGADIVITGVRAMPAELSTAHIHRLELPQGCFERRVTLPPGRYDAVRHRTQDGLLVISLRKLG